ncbi:MAG: NYN domain-containing protein [Candidatus Aenigmarchaeota archaeon]|nr:NYN domain-containing protein [Candidatus Aenigmarchaeota archaeon]
MYQQRRMPRRDDSGNQRVGIFVDGPNMLRKEFMIDLGEVRRVARKFGKISISKVFINQFAPEKLIEAVINEGFECIMVLGQMSEDKSTDVDVSLATAAVEAIMENNIETLVIVTRDADFLPVMQKAKEHGKTVVVIASEPGFSVSLKNAADHVELL